MKINEKSWHYKIVAYSTRHDKLPSNFCDYFTILTVHIALCLLAIVAFDLLLLSLIYGLIDGALITYSYAKIGFFWDGDYFFAWLITLTVAAGFYWGHLLSNKFSDNEIIQSIKDRTCVLIEYEKDDSDERK